MPPSDPEANRFSARAARYARVGLNAGGVAARIATSMMTGRSNEGDARNAAALAQALGGLKGPLMKVAQLVATIPDVVPPEYATELQKLQAEAPPMGAAFVKRRMMAELGPDWLKRFKTFDLHPAAAASLGQVHRATAHDGQSLACKLQYPDMESAVAADLKQLQILFSLQRQIGGAIDTREIVKEIGDRVREELDYEREGRHAALYGNILSATPEVRVPAVRTDLSTRRLLSLGWLDGDKLLDHKGDDQATRNRIAKAMFLAWWRPFARYGVIHGDPHLGNYTVFSEDGAPQGLNLLDYGCIRIFPASFVDGVVQLRRGFLENDMARIVHGYEIWGFKGLTRELIDILNIWGRFIYGPLLDDRVRTIADGVAPGEYGRRQAFEVHKALKEKGPLLIPREFVFMDRAAIGLGAVFLHLNAELNFFRLIEEELDNYTTEQVADRQSTQLRAVGLASTA